MTNDEFLSRVAAKPYRVRLYCGLVAIPVIATVGFVAVLLDSIGGCSFRRGLGEWMDALVEQFEYVKRGRVDGY